MRPMLAGSGPDALAALESAWMSNDPIRLALIDGHMPVMDGFELAERIRSDSRFSHMAVIMLTSAGNQRRGPAYRAIGAFLIKPVKQSDLFDAIVTVLGTPEHALVAAPRHELGKRDESRPPLRILLAEDNAVNQMMVVRLIEKRGHTIVVVGNGREAIAALHADPAFDLILMDIQMPEMGGFEATAAIREEEGENGRHIPIVAMTAHAMKGDRKRCLAAGMDAYLTKPIDVRELFGIIESIKTDRLKAVKQDEDPVDTAALFARVDGDRGFLRELIALFLDDCPKMLSRIRDAIDRGDAETLRSAAHALKGSVGNFAAPAAMAAALNLETLGREARLAEADAGYRELEKQIERVEAALRELAKAPERSGP
jgi:CheY-like chemotaxis protein